MYPSPSRSRTIGSIGTLAFAAFIIPLTISLIGLIHGIGKIGLIGGFFEPPPSPLPSLPPPSFGGKTGPMNEPSSLLPPPSFGGKTGPMNEPSSPLPPPPDPSESVSSGGYGVPPPVSGFLSECAGVKSLSPSFWLLFFFPLLNMGESGPLFKI